jgi:hypothetical protein
MQQRRSFCPMMLCVCGWTASLTFWEATGISNILEQLQDYGIHMSRIGNHQLRGTSRPSDNRKFGLEFDGIWAINICNYVCICLEAARRCLGLMVLVLLCQAFGSSLGFLGGQLGQVSRRPGKIVWKSLEMWFSRVFSMRIWIHLQPWGV